MAATKQSARRYPKATPIDKPAAGSDDPAALIADSLTDFGRTHLQQVCDDAAKELATVESADAEGEAPASMTCIGRRAHGAIAGDPVDDDEDEDEADGDDEEDDDEDEDDEVDDTPDQYPDEGNPDDEDDPTAIGRQVTGVN